MTEEGKQWRNRIIERKRMRVGDLEINRYNNKTHPHVQQERLQAVLDKFGIVGDLVAYYSERNDGKLTLFDGHARQGLDPNAEWEVGITDLDDSEVDELVLYFDPLAALARQEADRTAALMADLDVQEQALREMLEEQAQGLGFAYGKNGEDPQEVPEAELDRAAELQEKWGTALGQVWELGAHRLVCGDCRDKAVVSAVLTGKVPELCVTDPPYGVDYDPMFRQRALGAAVRRAGRIANDDNASWKAAFELFQGDVAYVWHADKHAIESGLDLRGAGFEIRATIIWRKSHAPYGQGHYNFQHEPCWYSVRKGKASHWIGNRKDSTVWDIALDTTVEGGHGTQKPFECMARPIRNHEGDVYDPFVGSGTTLVACEQLGRRCMAIDIDPTYVAVTLERWHQLTGLDPRLVE